MEIKVDLFDPKSLTEAIKKVEGYTKSVEVKNKRILEKLSYLGVKKCELHFSYALIHHTQTLPTITSEVKGNTLTIYANGEDVAFIEFGAGVKFGKGYQGKRPKGIVGIGEYGYGMGKRESGWWFTYEPTGRHIHTYGNPPAMAMYKTVQELSEEIIGVVREEYDRQN